MVVRGTYSTQNCIFELETLHSYFLVVLVPVSSLQGQDAEGRLRVRPAEVGAGQDPAGLPQRLRVHRGAGELGALHLDQGRPRLQEMGPGNRVVRWHSRL